MEDKVVVKSVKGHTSIAEKNFWFAIGKGYGDRSFSIQALANKIQVLLRKGLGNITYPYKIQGNKIVYGYEGSSDYPDFVVETAELKDSISDAVSSSTKKQITADLERDGFEDKVDFNWSGNELIFRHEEARRRAEGLIPSKYIASSLGSTIVIKDSVFVSDASTGHKGCDAVLAWIKKKNYGRYNPGRDFDKLYNSLRNEMMVYPKDIYSAIDALKKYDYISNDGHGGYYVNDSAVVYAPIVDDDETIAEFDLDTMPSVDGEQKVKLHTGGKVIEVEVESEEHEQMERLKDADMTFKKGDSFHNKTGGKIRVHNIRKDGTIEIESMGAVRATNPDSLQRTLMQNGYVRDAKSIKASFISVGRKLLGDDNEVWTVTSVRKSSGGIEVSVKSGSGEKDEWYFESAEQVPLADSQKVFKVKDSAGRQYAVFANSSYDAVRKVRDAKSTGVKK